MGERWWWEQRFFGVRRMDSTQLPVSCLVQMMSGWDGTILEVDMMQHSLFYSYLMDERISARIAQYLLRSDIRSALDERLETYVSVHFVCGQTMVRSAVVVHTMGFLANVMRALENTANQIAHIECWPRFVRRALASVAYDVNVASGISHLLRYDDGSWLEQFMCVESLRRVDRDHVMHSTTGWRDANARTRATMPSAATQLVRVIVRTKDPDPRRDVNHLCGVAEDAHTPTACALAGAVYCCLAHTVRQTRLAHWDVRCNEMSASSVRKDTSQPHQSNTPLLLEPVHRCRNCQRCGTPDDDGTDALGLVHALFKRVADVLAGGASSTLNDCHHRCIWCALVRAMCQAIRQYMQHGHSDVQHCICFLSTAMEVQESWSSSSSASMEGDYHHTPTPPPSPASRIRMNETYTVPLGRMLQDAMRVLDHSASLLQQCHTLDTRPSYKDIVDQPRRERAQARLPRMVRALQAPYNRSDTLIQVWPDARDHVPCRDLMQTNLVLGGLMKKREVTSCRECYHTRHLSDANAAAATRSHDDTLSCNSDSLRYQTHVGESVMRQRTWRGLEWTSDGAAYDEDSSVVDSMGTRVAFVRDRARLITTADAWNATAYYTSEFLGDAESVRASAGQIPMVCVPQMLAQWVFGSRWELMQAVRWLYHNFFARLSYRDGFRGPKLTTLTMHPMDPAVAYYRMLPIVLHRLCVSQHTGTINTHAIWQDLQTTYLERQTLQPQQHIRKQQRAALRRQQQAQQQQQQQQESMQRVQVATPAVVHDTTSTPHSQPPLPSLSDDEMTEHDRMQLHNYRISALAPFGAYDPRKHGEWIPNLHVRARPVCPTGQVVDGSAACETPLDAQLDDMDVQVALSDNDESDGWTSDDESDDAEMLQEQQQQQRPASISDNGGLIALEPQDDASNASVWSHVTEDSASVFFCDDMSRDEQQPAPPEPPIKRRGRGPNRVLNEGMGDMRTYRMSENHLQSNLLAFLAPYAVRVVVDNRVLYMCWRLLLSNERLWVRHHQLATLLIELMESTSSMRHRNRCPTWLVWRTMRLAYVRQCETNYPRRDTASTPAKRKAPQSRYAGGTLPVGPSGHWVREIITAESDADGDVESGGVVDGTNARRESGMRVRVRKLTGGMCECAVCKSVSHERKPHPADREGHRTQGFWTLHHPSSAKDFWEDVARAYVPVSQYASVRALHTVAEGGNVIYHPLAVVPPFPSTPEDASHWMNEYRPRLPLTFSKRALGLMGGDCAQMTIPTRLQLQPTLDLPVHFLLYKLACDPEISDSDAGIMMCGVHARTTRFELRPPRASRKRSHIKLFVRSCYEARRWCERMSSDPLRDCTLVASMHSALERNRQVVQWIANKCPPLWAADVVGQHPVVHLDALMFVMLASDAMRRLPYFGRENRETAAHLFRGPYGPLMRSFYGEGATRATVTDEAIRTLLIPQETIMAAVKAWHAGITRHNSPLALFPAFFQEPTHSADALEDLDNECVEVVAHKDAMCVWDSPWTRASTVQPAVRRQHPHMPGPFTEASARMVHHMMYWPIENVMYEHDQALAEPPTVCKSPLPSDTTYTHRKRKRDTAFETEAEDSVLCEWLSKSDSQRMAHERKRLIDIGLLRMPEPTHTNDSTPANKRQPQKDCTWLLSSSASSMQYGTVHMNLKVSV